MTESGYPQTKEGLSDGRGCEELGVPGVPAEGVEDIPELVEESSADAGVGLGTECQSRPTVPSEIPGVEVMVRVAAGATTAATEAETGRLQQASSREGRQ